MAISSNTLTVLALFVLSFLGIYAMSQILDGWQKSMNIGSVENTSILLKEETEFRLANIAQVKATAIDVAMEDHIDDVEMIAAKMNTILKNPQNYLPRTLPDIAVDGVQVEVPYIFYAPELLQKGISPELQEEISLVSNIVDELRSLAINDRGYSAGYFIGSKNGYSICVDSFQEPMYKIFTEDFIGKYDPRKRNWYESAETSGRAVVTDFYTDITGVPVFSVAIPYYDAQGFAGVAGVDCSITSFDEHIEDTTVGHTNFNIVINNEGKILFSSRKEGQLVADVLQRDLRESEEETLSLAAKRMVAGGTGTTQVTVDDKEYYLAYAPISSVGWSFGTLVAVEEVQRPIVAVRASIEDQFKTFRAWMQPTVENFQRSTYSILIALSATMLALGFWLSGRFSKPILELSDSVRKIASGNLDVKAKVDTGDEIGHLAECFNDMTDNLKEQIKNLSIVTAEKERIATELKVATGIQAGMLPQIFPKSMSKDKFDLFATMNPAKEVGGDFYDFYFVDDDHLIVTIADVSDKGVPAALFMVISKTILRNNALTFSNKSLADVVERANDQLCEGNDEGMFVTVFIAQINFKTGELIYVNAGHNPPLIRHGADKKFSYLPQVKKSPMLGVGKGIHFPQNTFNLDKGDVLFMYTDGVTEAMNKKRELFTEERLKENLNQLDKNFSAEKIIDAVQENIHEHVQGAEQSDDITMLAVVYD